MDTTDADIYFDEDGVCNYYYEYKALMAKQPSKKERETLLHKELDQIKRAAVGKKYDCVLGLSGGVDSSYMMVLADRFDLRPLVVHFDNGWNSELAVANIEALCRKFNFELETFVMDWEEFRDIQRAYFKASVVDLEVPTDHMIFGALHKIAAQHGIKYILSGVNNATEWLMPVRWNYSKRDETNLRNIHAKFGARKIEALPAIGVWKQAWYHYGRRIRSVPLLEYVEYKKHDVKRYLIEECGWRDYGGKHYESVFTRFYQGYILPRKFGIDKRKAHLSNLILNEEMTRDEALIELQQPPYDENLQENDKDYVAKKLGFSIEEFEQVLSLPNVPHEKYGTDKADRARYMKIVSTLGKALRTIRSVRSQAPKASA
jgi:N-acetyl sugar amidotransferase